MGRRDIQTNAEVSPEHEELGHVLSSIENGKNELDSIGKTNKRILSEIEDNKKSLSDLELTKESLNAEISEIKNRKERHLRDLNTVKDDLSELENRKTKAEKELALFKGSSENEKVGLQGTIASLHVQIEKAKKEHSQHVEISGKEKKVFEKRIIELNDSLSALLRRESEQKEKNDTLINICNDLSRKKISLQGDVEKVSREISKQTEVLKELELREKEISSFIKDKKSELQDIENKILEKKEEYKNQERKLFTIREREAALEQREVFIKNKFEQAHVPWE